MPSQSCRGHVIGVTRFPLGERIACLDSIRTIVTFEVRHRDACRSVSFGTDRAAHDHAFSDARSWVERFPLRRPFLAGAP